MIKDLLLVTVLEEIRFLSVDVLNYQINLQLTDLLTSQEQLLNLHLLQQV